MLMILQVILINNIHGNLIYYLVTKYNNNIRIMIYRNYC